MDTIQPLSEERIAASEATGQALGRTTMLANSEATRSRTKKPTGPSRLDAYHSIKLDSEIALALEDSWQASGNPDFRDWLEKFANDAMRGQLGV